MIDYSYIKGSDMDRLIADRLGWRMSSINGDLRPNHVRHQLINPEGQPVAYSNDEDGWKALGRFIPAYSTDLNVAFELLRPVEYFGIGTVSPEHRRLNDGDYEAVITVGSAEDHKHYVGQADTPALAICRAWLAWQEVKPPLA